MSSHKPRKKSVESFLRRFKLAANDSHRAGVGRPIDPKVASLSRSAVDSGFGEIRFLPTKTGWHTFRIRSFETPPQNEKPQYWLR